MRANISIHFYAINIILKFLKTMTEDVTFENILTLHFVHDQCNFLVEIFFSTLLKIMVLFLIFNLE